MSCEESKQLTVGLITNRASNELLSKFAQGIENAKSIKDLAYRRQTIQAYEELGEIVTMSALANENPLYREALIKRAKAFTRTADMAQIVDGIDNLPGLQQSVTDAGLSIATLQERLQAKIVRDYVLVKGKGINALLKGEFAGKTVNDILGKKKLMKLTSQELKDELGIADAYFNILEETDNSKKLTEYVVNRELLGPADAKVWQGLPSLPVKNKIEKKDIMALIKKAKDEDMYNIITLYGRNISKDGDLIKAVKARKGVDNYTQIVDYLANAAKTSKSIGEFDASVSEYMKKFTEQSIKASPEYKNTAKLYPTLEGRLSAIAKSAKTIDEAATAIAKARKDLETFVADETNGPSSLTNKFRNKVIAMTSQGGITAKKVAFWNTRADFETLGKEHLALANLYEQYYRKDAVTLGDIETITTAKEAKKLLKDESQYILVQNVKQYNDISKELTASERARIIFPSLSQDLGYFADGGRLYIGGKPYAKDIVKNNLKYLGVDPQLFGAEFDDAWKEFINVRLGDIDEKAMQALGSPEQFIENDKLVLNALGNRIADVVDVSKAWEEFDALDEATLASYLQEIINKNYDEATASSIISSLDITDYNTIKKDLYNYKYASTPESAWKALENLTNDGGLSNNPGVIAINMLNKLQDAGYSFPGYSTLHAFVDAKVAGKETIGSRQFVEDFIAKNPVEGTSTLVDNRKVAIDNLDAFYQDSLQGTSSFAYKETPTEGTAKVFVEFNGDILGAVRNDIADRSQRVTIETLGQEVNDDLAGLNRIVDDYSARAKESINKGEGHQWRLKEEAAAAVKEYEDYLTNKYGSLLDNERQLRTSKYNLVKVVNESDAALLVSEGEKIKQDMADRLSRVLTQEYYNPNSFKDGVFVGGYKDRLKNIDGLNTDLRNLLNKIDVDALSQSDAKKLFNFFQTNKYALNNIGNRYVLAYDTIFPGMKNFFKDYEVVVTTAGELPYKLSVETVAGVGGIVDKEVKADIFTMISKQIKAGKPLDPDALADAVEVALQKNGVAQEFNQAYIDMFAPYYKLYKLPKEIVDTLPAIVPIDAETRKILEGIDYQGDDGVQSLAHYFDRTPDNTVPQVLKEKNVFAQAELPQVQLMVDDFKANTEILERLSTVSAEAEAKFNKLSMTSGVGVLQKYGTQNKKLKKVVELVDRLVPKAKPAAESLENITVDTLEAIQKGLTKFMGMGDQQFIEARIAPLTTEEANAYRIADFFRTFNKGSKGLTGTPYDAVMQDARRFVAEELGAQDVPNVALSLGGSGRFRAFKRSVSGSRIFGITGVDFGSKDFARLLDQDKLGTQVDIPFGKTSLYKQEIKGGATALAKGVDADTLILENVNKLLGVNMSKVDAYKLLNALDHIDRESIPGLTWMTKYLNSRVLKMAVGTTQLIEGLAALPSNIKGFINRGMILSQGLGARDDQLALARELMEKYGMVNVNVPGLSDIRGALGDAAAPMYAKIRRAIGNEGLPVGISDLNNPSVYNVIREVAEASAMSPQNLLDVVFSDDARVKHLLAAVERRGFSSMEDLGYMLSKLPDGEAKDIIDDINAMATKTYSADIAMPSADLYKQGRIIGDIPYLSKGLSYGYEQAIALPFGWKAGWGNTSAAQFFRRFGQTGNMAHYLVKNGFSEEAKTEVVKRVLNNPEYINFIEQLASSAVNVQRYKRLVYDQDDWSTIDGGDASDYTNAMKDLIMPVQGLLSSSLWRVFGDIIGADDKTAATINVYGRAYSQFGYLRSAAVIADSFVQGGAKGGYNALVSEVAKIGGGGIRYQLDDMENNIKNNYALSNPQLGGGAMRIGQTVTPTRKIISYLNNVKVADQIAENGLLNVLYENVIMGGRAGQAFTLWIDFVKGNLGGEKSNTLLGLRGSKDKLFGVLKDEPLLKAIDATGVLDFDKLRANKPAYKEYMDVLQSKIAFGTKPYTHFTDGIDYFLNGETVKDTDLYVMFKVIADEEGPEYIQGLKDRLGGRQTDEQKLQTLGNIYTELSQKGYNIPGLNNQVAQYKAKLNYDNELEAATKLWGKQNKAIYGKSNAASFPPEQKQALQDKYAESYINEIKDFDWNAYQDVMLNAITIAGADKLGDYVKKGVDNYDKPYVELLPKRKSLLKQDLDIRRAVADGDTHNLGLRMNNIYAGIIDSPKITDETRILMTKSIMDYYEQQGNLTDAEKFHIKSDILIGTKNLIGKANKIKDLLGNDFYTAFVESYYGTKLQGDQVIRDMQSALNDGKAIGGGGNKKTNFGTLNKTNAVIAKLINNQKILRDGIKANTDIFKGVKAVTIPQLGFGYDWGKPNKSPKPFESAGVSSSISKVSLGQKVAQSNKDIKRIYSVKKVKGTPKPPKEKAA